MKYLKYLQTINDFESFKNSGEYVLPNVNYVKELDSVDFNPYVPPIPAGGIVYFTGGKLKSIHYNEWDASLGTPIGVITIPEGFAPDGKARMVALSGETSKMWCPSSARTDTSLTNYTRVPTTDNAGSTSNGSNLYGYLPSDKFTGATSYVDSVAKYYGSTPMIPSPYAGDAANPEYCKEIGGNNALSDFNGLENTRTLIELDSTNYQAANHCWTYKDAANSGTQWYLPACGELGYMMPRFNEIIAGLGAVSAVQLNSSSYYWSSSEYSSNYAYNAGTGNGSVSYTDKDYNKYTRPWAIVE